MLRVNFQLKKTGEIMPDLTRRIHEYAAASAKALETSLTANDRKIVELTHAIVESLEKGGKVLFFGNGGSAADAQHLAAEFVNRYLIDRDELAGLALTTDTSVLTSISNDFGYSLIFAKQIRALANPQDVAIGISTSGTSKNVLLGLEAAKKIGCVTIGFCGSNTLPMEPYCRWVVGVDSKFTPIIQQGHIAIGHILCELVEAKLFGRENS